MTSRQRQKVELLKIITRYSDSWLDGLTGPTQPVEGAVTFIFTRLNSGGYSVKIHEQYQHQSGPVELKPDHVVKIEVN
jgi:hypothetical protein